MIDFSFGPEMSVGRKMFAPGKNNETAARTITRTPSLNQMREAKIGSREILKCCGEMKKVHC